MSSTRRRAAVGTTACVYLSALLSAGCGPAAVPSPKNDRLAVFAGIPPLAYLVEQIGGEHVAVDVLVRPGQDPHTFEPTPRQVSALSRAAMFFRIGMSFEGEIVKKIQAGGARLMVVDVDRGVPKRKVDAPCCQSTASDGADGADVHAHPVFAEPDPHVWLSPPLLKIQADNIAEALCRADPSHRGDYIRNLAALQERLDDLHRRVQQRLAPYRGRAFYVFHPGFGYFADAYGLREKAVEVAGREPSPRQLRVLVEKAKKDGATTIFLQPQYAPQGARAVAEEIGGGVDAIDGLKRNVLADIEDIARKVEKAMEKEGSRSKVQDSKPDK
jgi:zinc transport system substrate-binding protein